MKVQELPVKDWLAHLRRHPIPEIMDDACLDALKSVEAQYGEEISHGAGLEVRLGEEARYVDYIMNFDAGRTFFAIRADGSFSPCLHLVKRETAETLQGYWESPSMEDFRKTEPPEGCGKCAYTRRCLPCPAAENKCPVQQ